MKNNATGIKKYINSFGYAFAGIADLVRGQFHAKVHVAAMFLVVTCGFYFKINATEWCLVTLSIGAVIGSEAMNTAVEYIVDMVSPEYHVLAGKAKDVAAGAVLIVAIAAAFVAAIIFLPKIFQLLEIS
jgi:diacylglycerol kinase